MPDDDRDKPKSPDETGDTLRRIETLLESLLKELRQVRGIIGKRRDKEAEPAERK